MGLKTIFGTANVDSRGYYAITSAKEGNLGKQLHRLIYENVWGKIPEGHHIHHIDENKLNNCILNLIALPARYHHQLHTSKKRHPLYGKQGKNNPNYGKPRSEETKRKISEAHTGLKYSLESKIINSKSKNKTGYFRVYTNKRNNLKQGFTYVYSWYDEDNYRRVISSIDIKKLEKKVKSKGLPWIKFEKED